MQQTLVSKSEFAALINVSPGRVSQFISAGQISPTAIVGTGQRAKIIVEQAKADLRLTLDVSQRLGNGIDTRIDAGIHPAPAATSGPAAAEPTPSSGGMPPPLQLTGIDHEIKQQKLEQLRRANRNAAISDAQAGGQLTETDQARAEMARIAGAMLQVFEGALSDFASAVSAEFKVTQRDVLHLLRLQFRKVRESAVKQAKAQAVDVPDTVETVLEAEEIETLN